MPPENSRTLPDQAIVERVRAGDVEAFAGLVERHRDHVFRIVARHVPSDLVAETAHEAFVRAYLSLDRYEPQRPFEHWLARIALRAACDYWREQYRRRPEADPPTPEQERFENDPEPGRHDDREMLEWALDRLALDDRLVLTLVYFEELSVRECAELLGWSEANVKVRSHRARQRLKALLESVTAEKRTRP